MSNPGSHALSAHLLGTPQKNQQDQPLPRVDLPARHPGTAVAMKDSGHLAFALIQRSP